MTKEPINPASQAVLCKGCGAPEPMHYRGCTTMTKEPSAELERLSKESLRGLMCLYAQAPDEVVKDVHSRVGAYIDALIADNAAIRDSNAELITALQEIQRWAEYAYGKPHDFTAKLGAIAKEALARHNADKGEV